MLQFATCLDEAVEIADRIEAWLDAGVPPSKIVLLVRQQPHLVCELLIDELNDRGIASRNEQLRQDLTAEPAAVVILNLIRVLAGDRRSAEYEHLMRLISRASSTEEMALRSARAVSRFLEATREHLREGTAERSSPVGWEKAIQEFLELVTRPIMHALSPE